MNGTSCEYRCRCPSLHHGRGHFASVPIIEKALKRFLLILEPVQTTEDRAAAAALPVKIVARYGSTVLEVETDEDASVLGAALPVRGVFDGAVDLDLSGVDEAGRLAVAAWNERHGPDFAKRKRLRPGAGRSWGEPPKEE